MRSSYTSFFVIALLLFFVGCETGTLPDLPETPQDPGAVSNQNIAGQAVITSEAYEVYSRPISGFRLEPESLSPNANGEAELSVEVADTIVYDTGYVYLDGQGWQQISLESSQRLSSDWLRADSGVASTDIRIDEAFDSESNFVIIYSCSLVGNAFDCHENKWQIRSFETQGFEDCEEGAVVNGQVCLNGNFVDIPETPGSPVADTLANFPEFITDSGEYTIVLGETGPLDHLTTAVDIVSIIQARELSALPTGVAELDINYEFTDENVILVGNACVNARIGDALGNPEDCMVLAENQAELRIVDNPVNDEYSVLIVHAHPDSDLLRMLVQSLRNYAEGDGPDTTAQCFTGNMQGGGSSYEACETYPQEESQFYCNENSIIGDITGDSIINQEDRDGLLQLAEGNSTLQGSMCCADVNDDGLVNSYDASLLERFGGSNYLNPLSRSCPWGERVAVYTNETIMFNTPDGTLAVTFTDVDIDELTIEFEHYTTGDVLELPLNFQNSYTRDVRYDVVLSRAGRDIPLTLVVPNTGEPFLEVYEFQKGEPTSSQETIWTELIAEDSNSNTLGQAVNNRVNELRWFNPYRITTQAGTTDVEQFLEFGNQQIQYTESNSGVEDYFLVFEEGSPIYTYRVEFTDGLQSDIDNGELDDLQGESLMLMGDSYTIFSTGTIDEGVGGIQLDLARNSISDSLRSNQSRIYSVGGSDYEVRVAGVDRNTSVATVQINGDEFEFQQGEIARLPNEMGEMFFLTESVLQSYDCTEATGRDSVTFNAVYTDPTDAGNNFNQTRTGVSSQPFGFGTPSGNIEIEVVIADEESRFRVNGELLDRLAINDSESLSVRDGTLTITVVSTDLDLVCESYSDQSLVEFIFSDTILEVIGYSNGDGSTFINQEEAQNLETFVDFSASDYQAEILGLEFELLTESNWRPNIYLGERDLLSEFVDNPDELLGDLDVYFRDYRQTSAVVANIAVGTDSSLDNARFFI